MRTLIIFALTSFILFAGQAQTVTPVIISNDGGFSSVAAGSIEWTIGEPVSETYTGTLNITTMGFHQPQIDLYSMIGENKNGDNGLLVYPNPVRDELKINFNGMEQGMYSVRMTDAIGKLILETGINVTGDETSLQIKVNEVAAGNYFLVISGKNSINTVKITKVL